MRDLLRGAALFLSAAFAMAALFTIGLAVGVLIWGYTHSGLLVAAGLVEVGCIGLVLAALVQEKAQRRGLQKRGLSPDLVDKKIRLWRLELLFYVGAANLFIVGALIVLYRITGL